MLLTTLLIGTANAAADLQTTILMPSGELAYEEQEVQVRVKNQGGALAKNVRLTVQLPQTNTSPSVHVMGDLGAIDSQCVQNGTQLDCNLGKIKGGKTKTVRVFISLPWSEGSLDFSATAVTSTNDSNPGNDSDSAVAEVNYPDRVISGPQHASNRHCTGQGLEAFYECTLYPSSISAHGITFNADGSLAIDGNPAGYTGVWGQDYDDQLWFEYSLDGQVVASFEGNAVDADCFEGLTHFPGSAYVAPYEVCLD